MEENGHSFGFIHIQKTSEKNEKIFFSIFLVVINFFSRDNFEKKTKLL